MNIEFLIDKEKEKVIVSNEKGKIKSRDYQDNIEDILVMEDVVEFQEEDLKNKIQKRKNMNKKSVALICK